ncbi:MAG: Hemerythrin domain protein, partial [uncultured Nocardioidaceae bacterium]
EPGPHHHHRPQHRPRRRRRAQDRPPRGRADVHRARGTPRAGRGRGPPARGHRQRDDRAGPALGRRGGRRLPAGQGQGERRGGRARQAGARRGRGDHEAAGADGLRRPALRGGDPHADGGDPHARRGGGGTDVPPHARGVHRRGARRDEAAGRGHQEARADPTAPARAEQRAAPAGRWPGRRALRPAPRRGVRARLERL